MTATRTRYRLQCQVPTEEREQFAVADYLRWRGVLFNHTPNEGRRLPQYVLKLKRLGMRTGFPDLFVYEPRGQYHGLAIEMKRRVGGVLSDAQEGCLQALRERGYRTEVCKGFDAAKVVIDEYLAGGDE